MESIWTQTVNKVLDMEQPSQIVTQDLRTDTLIIGGGMAGLLCGHFLNEQGADYILIDQQTIAGHTTAGTTAKITTQHGLVYNKIFTQYGAAAAQGYYLANHMALEKFSQMAKNIECDFERKDNLIYDTDSPQKIMEELKTLEIIGGKGFYLENPEGVPFSVKASLVTPFQAQFHPLKFLRAIAASQDSHIYEYAKALDIEEERSGYAVTIASNLPQTEMNTDKHTPIRTIHANRVIIATHYPFKNLRGLYFLKMHQSRSYAVLLNNINPSKIPNYMIMGTQADDLSIRSYEDNIILGGRGGKTGKNHKAFSYLADDGQVYYPKSTIRAMWAAQDCMTLDQIPYIGSHHKTQPNIKVATGFNKWGMTSAMVAALILTGQMDTELAQIFDPNRSIFHPQLLVNAANAAVNLVKPKSPRCSHMGCALKWNEAEQSWDCPCHGSRYDKDGKILNEPAQRSIHPL